MEFTFPDKDWDDFFSKKDTEEEQIVQQVRSYTMHAWSSPTSFYRHLYITIISCAQNFYPVIVMGEIKIDTEQLNGI